MKNVCIFGASCSSIDKRYTDDAYAFGALIAQNGYGMVFGGGDTGVMGAAARGASSQGGHITGVIPEKLNRPGIAYPHCTELIVTKDMHERKATMERLSGFFAALPGGFGTLEELMEVITLNQLGYLSAPVIILNTGGFYDDLIAQFSRFVAERFAAAAAAGIYAIADTPEEAAELIRTMKPPVLPDKLNDALRGIEGGSKNG